MWSAKEIIEKVLKRIVSTKHYNVRGKQILSEEQVVNLISSRCKGTIYIREEGEKGFGRPIAFDELDDKLDNAWIEIDTIFKDKQAAIDYTRGYINEGSDGSHAIIEEVTVFFSEESRNIIYELRKENGEVIGMEV